MTRFPIRIRRAAHPALHRVRAPWLLLAVAVIWLGPTAASRLAAAEPTADAPAAETPSPPPSDEQIGRWIEQLSDDSYVARHSAADRLLAAGMAARGALVGVADGPDPETRAAARRLVALIDRTEFSHRLDAFAADTDGRLGATLPGWKAFTELVGDDVRARALFVDMQRAEAPLLAQVFGHPANERNRSWEDRLTRLLRGRVVVDRRHGPPLGSCATMLFLGTLPKPVPSDQAAMDLARITEFPATRAALQNDERRDAVRRLVTAWIVHCANRNNAVLQQRLRISLTYGLVDAVPLAIAVVSDPEYLTVSPSVRVLAILAIGKLGGPEQVDVLEPLLNDTTVCLRGRVRRGAGQLPPEVQIRDVALAVMLQLTGQDLQKYGFPAVRRHVRTLFTPETLYLPSDDKRAAAIEKWRRWRAANSGKDG